MIRRIFIDLDGVLNRFQGWVFKRLGLDYDPLSYKQYPVEAGWDIVKAANIIAGEERWTTSAFWKSVTQDVWATVPLSDEAHWLLGHCEQLVGRDNIAILTSPTLAPDCAAGKVEWIQQYMPKWLQRQFFIGPKKRLIAAPDALLIDDSSDNIDEWVKAGGKGLIVPRPWNRANSIKNPFPFLMSHFEMMFNERNANLQS